jgi:hypothetical protein
MLRLNNLPQKENILVLDCFAGSSLIWNTIKKKSDKNIQTLAIDIKKGNKNLVGNNIKFLKSMDLTKFDVIDLDSYGIPYEQLEILFNKRYRGQVFITFIQSMYGGINKGILKYNGISEEMTKKIKSLFNREGFNKFKNYLAIRGVTEIRFMNNNNKYYACITL